ncbi:MAG: DUF3047 domain-containing protein [Syntrophales bacterium]|jgi:hypothetical protein
MKRKLTLIISVSLLLSVIPLSGCQKADEPKKPEVAAAAPASPPSLQMAMVTSVPEKPKTPVAPLAATTPAPPSAPVTHEPTASPEPRVAPSKPRGTDIIRVAGFDSARMREGCPSGWLLDIKKGEPTITLERGSQFYYLHMKSNESAYGIKSGIQVDIKEYPYLNWRWKVTRLPDGGDVRKNDTDDQAMQIYVAFTPTGFPEALNTPVLGYIWDNEAPKSWTGRSSAIGGGKLRYVVIRNKTDRLGQWYTEKRNIYEDYKKLLKDVECADPTGVTHGVEFYINTQNTKSTAESYIGDVYFSKR